MLNVVFFSFPIQIWCAAGVNLNGGRTKDGGSVVGASVFYSSPPEENSSSENLSEVEKLSQELTVSSKFLYVKNFNSFL